MLIESTFESGFEGWEPDTAFTGGRDAFRFERTDTVTAFSSTCVLMAHAGPGGPQWITRDFLVEPGRYELEVSRVSGPVHGAPIHRAVAYIGKKRPRPAAEPSRPLVTVPGLTTSSDDPSGESPARLSFGRRLTLEPSHTFWVAVGFAGTWAAPMRVCVDDVRVEATPLGS